MNSIRLRTHLAKILVAVMLWIGLAGPMAVVHARTLDAPKNALVELEHQAKHIEAHADHGHHGGVIISHGDAPVQDPDCLEFCAELMDTPGVLALVTEHTVLESSKDEDSHLAWLWLYPSDAYLGSAAAASATGPPFGRYLCAQSETGLTALLARNHRLRL